MQTACELAFLCLDDDDVIDVEVAELAGDRCELTLARPPRSGRIGALVGTIARLEWATSVGMASVPGVLAWSESSRGRSPALRVRFERRGNAQVLQRRAFVRVPYVGSVALTPLRPLGLPLRCTTANLSAGGLLVSGLPGARVGDLYGFRLELEHGEWPVSGTCRVVRATPDGNHAVQFATIPSDDRDRLIAFAFRRERRLELQRRRDG